MWEELRREDDGDGDEAEALNTISFTGKDGRTTVTTLVRHTSQEHRDAHINSRTEEGMQDALDLQ